MSPSVGCDTTIYLIKSLIGLVYVSGGQHKLTLVRKVLLGRQIYSFLIYKNKSVNNFKIYLPKFKTRKQKSKPTGDFEKELNFTPVFFFV